jgi:hypothetical protein
MIWGISCLTVFGVSADKLTEVARGFELLRGRIVCSRIMRNMFGQIWRDARHAVAAVVWEIRVHECFVSGEGWGWLLQKENQGKNLLVLGGFSATIFPPVTSKE